MEEENIIKIPVPDSKFVVVGERQNNRMFWDVYLVDPELNYKEILRENVTRESLEKFIELQLKPTNIKRKQVENNEIIKNTDPTPIKKQNKVDSSPGKKIIWTIVILLLVWYIYSLGNNSNRVLSPQEIQEEIRNCNRWGYTVVYDKQGLFEECLPPSGKDY